MFFFLRQKRNRLRIWRRILTNFLTSNFPAYIFTNCLYKTLSPLTIFITYTPAASDETFNPRPRRGEEEEMEFICIVFITTPEDDITDIVDRLLFSKPVV